MVVSSVQEDIIATRNYKINEKIVEKPKITGVGVVRSAIHDAKGMLYEAGIALGDDYEVELSHHYGMKHFRQHGAIIINIINIRLSGLPHENYLHQKLRKWNSRTSP